MLLLLLPAMVLLVLRVDQVLRGLVLPRVMPLLDVVLGFMGWEWLLRLCLERGFWLEFRVGDSVFWSF
jgi:hypothetical protein